MTRRTIKAPTPARVDASELQSSPARSSAYPTFGLASQEVTIAVSRLSRRFGLLPSTALAVAEANQWGCA